MNDYCCCLNEKVKNFTTRIAAPLFFPLWKVFWLFFIISHDLKTLLFSSLSWQVEKKVTPPWIYVTRVTIANSFNLSIRVTKCVLKPITSKMFQIEGFFSLLTVWKTLVSVRPNFEKVFSTLNLIIWIDC